MHSSAAIRTRHSIGGINQWRVDQVAPLRLWLESAFVKVGPTCADQEVIDSRERVV